jgi:hypothetical protein
MDSKLVSYYIGITIVILSHLYTLSKTGINSGEMSVHSVANLIAAALIAYYFVNKEKFFK